MKTLKLLVFPLLTVGFLVFSGCGENPILLFSVNDDIMLGQQVADQIESDPATYPILSRAQYPEAYAYLEDMRDEILNSGEVRFRDEFPWQVSIIQDDQTLNAFATPGGYIYVYTGLIKFLDREDDLAGVLGHEIAHSDRRHSSQQLQTQYGISILLSILLGQESSTLETIIGQLAGTVSGLAFSRNLESEADEFSVNYLANTRYACNGAFTFFQKLLDEGQTGGVPTFLSTHPDPANRIQEINERATEIGCSTDGVMPATYQEFIDSLP